MRLSVAAVALAVTFTAGFACVSDPPSDTPLGDGGSTDGATTQDGGASDGANGEGGASVLTLTPGTFHFVNEPAGAPVPHGFVLTNDGTTSIDSMASAGLSGPDAARFQITSDACRGLPLAPKATCTVTVAFAAPGVGEYQATLTVGAVTASLTGTATQYKTEASNTGHVLNTVWGRGTSVWLAGDKGLIAQRAGDGSWNALSTPSSTMDVRALCTIDGTYPVFAFGVDGAPAGMRGLFLGVGSSAWASIGLSGSLPPDAVGCASWYSSGAASMMTTAIASNGQYYVISGGSPSSSKDIDVDAGSTALHALSADSSGNMCAVGESGRVVAQNPLQGVAWTEGSAGGHTLRGVWAAPGGNAVLVAGDQGTLLSSSTGCGSSWNTETIPAWPGGTVRGLRAVYGVGPAEAYAVGDAGTILHRGSSSGWALEPSGTDQDLHAVWASADGKDVYVVAAGFVLHKHTP